MNILDPDIGELPPHGTLGAMRIIGDERLESKPFRQRVRYFASDGDAARLHLWRRCRDDGAGAPSAPDARPAARIMFESINPLE